MSDARPPAVPPRAPARTRPRAAEAAIPAALVALTLAIYLRTGSYGHVFDDAGFIVGNGGLAPGLSWAGVRWAFTTTFMANWYPVTWLSHLADATFFGSAPGPAHLVNAALHAAAGVTLLLVLRRLTGARWPAALAAALFLAHPLRVESVAWITERKDALSALLWLLAVGAWTRYARRPGAGRYAAVAGLFALALMTKQTTVALPFVLLLLDFWPLGRLRARGALPALLAEKLPLFLLAAAGGAIAVATQRGAGALGSWESYPPAVRLGNAALAAAAYLGTTLWPHDLAVYYPHPGRALPAGAALLSAGLLAALTAGALIAARRRPWLTVGWAWYLVTLLPVAGIVQAGGQGMADRFTYLPSMGLTMAIAGGLAGLARAGPGLRTPVAAAAVAAIAALAALSSAQAGVWRDDETLYRHALAVTKGNWLVHKNLGALLESRGRPAEAIAHFREAARIQPGFFAARMYLASTLEKVAATGASAPGGGTPLDEAEAAYRAALGIDPGSADAAVSLGTLLARRGRLPEARSLLEETARRHPDLAVVSMNLGIVLALEGRFDEAISRQRDALRLDPSSAEARRNLDLTLERAGRARRPPGAKP